MYGTYSGARHGMTTLRRIEMGAMMGAIRNGVRPEIMTVLRIDDELKQSVLCLTGLRVEILLTLSEGPAYVGDLTEQLELDYPSMSRALRALQRLGYVCKERDGRRLQYRIEPTVRLERLDGELLIHLAIPHHRRAILVLPWPQDESGVVTG